MMDTQAENRREESGTSASGTATKGRRLRRLGDVLAEANLISAQELDQLVADNEKGLRLGELILDLGVLTEEQLLPHISTHLGVPSVHLRDGILDIAAVRLIPHETSQRLVALALFNVHGTLTVAMDDPLDLIAIDEIERVTGLRVRPVFAFREGLTRLISRVYKDGFEVDTVTADLDEDAVEVREDGADLDLSAVDELIEGSPVINLVNYLILQAVRKRASDIHIEPGRKFSNVRFRVDGQLQEMLRPRRDIHPAMVSRIKVMSKMDIAEHHLPQDGRCQVVVEKKEIDLRISTLPTVDGEKVVIRILDRGRLSFDLEKLGIAGPQLDGLKGLLRKPHGLVLVTGPTGSGKTTTLYSGLELIKTVHNNIVTVEDPVEYQIDLVNQVQVDKARGLDFAGALRSILRQDPDVIMLGEIRDGETASVAVQAALTGHLVISTLHTNDSCGAITRLIDMGTPAYKVSAALQGVVAQRLVRTICPHCRTNYYPTREFLQSLQYQGDLSHRFQRGEGCRACFDTGNAGRQGIYEVLLVDGSMRRLISSNADSEVLKQHFLDSGGTTLLQTGLALAEQHVTSLEEVARVAFAE